MHFPRNTQRRQKEWNDFTASLQEYHIKENGKEIPKWLVFNTYYEEPPDGNPLFVNTELELVKNHMHPRFDYVPRIAVWTDVDGNVHDCRGYKDTEDEADAVRNVVSGVVMSEIKRNKKIVIGENETISMTYNDLLGFMTDAGCKLMDRAFETWHSI